MKEDLLKILFVCSMNRWRSPTAESVFRGYPLISARSRGTSRKAKRTVNSSDLRWADVVMVMENKHRNRLLSSFPGEMRYKDVYVLDVPDEYRFMDPELVDLLKLCVPPILDGRDA